MTTRGLQSSRVKPKGLKRPKYMGKHENATKKSRKKFDEKSVQISCPNSTDSASSDEDDMLTKQPAFDNLLKKLESESDKRALLLKKGQREKEGRSSSDEDEDGVFESVNASDEENGLGNESSLDDAGGDGFRQHKPSYIMKQSKEDYVVDEDEASNEDDASGSESESYTDADGTTSISSFHRHVGCILSNEDAEKTRISKWKYTLELPSADISPSKWVGTGEHLPKEDNIDMVYGVKQKLYKHWLDMYKASSFADLDSRMRFFFSLCNSYRDIMHCNKKPFYLKGEEDPVAMDAYLMHALNHVFKTRDTVSKNNAKLTKEQNANNEAIHSDNSFLDHGFTRPKVMFLLPLGSIALRVVKRLIQLIPTSNKVNVDHMDRFSKEFGTDDVEEEEENLKSKKPAKPKDFQRLFGGNNNDHFMVGIKITKRSIKMYNDFYTSDIIVASPLGLITKIGEAEAEKGKDVDYLSSIEVLIIDHADVIAMQNWSHLNTVVEQLNRKPSNQHGTDIMRIRPWYLDGHACFYRQTILLGSFLNPDMNALFNRSCLNFEGKVKSISECKGVLPKVLLQVRQVFPKMKDSVEAGIMVFTSSYFEYVRLRNFLTYQNASFCLFGDYAEPSDISRARVWFFEGKRKIMLYTERAHFYHRYKIRGIKNLFIYSLTERKEFYPEIVNMLDGSNKMTCNVLFSRFDHLRLERIVGTAAAKRMVSSDKNMFVFC